MRETSFNLRLLILLFAFSSSGLFSFAQCTTCQVHITPGAIDTLCDSKKLNWATWSNVTATSATGTISSSITVSCSQATGGMFTTGGMFNGGAFPVQYKVPVSTTALANSKAGVFTFCFNKPVTNPQIAFASIGNGGTPVQINTSVPYCVIWQGLNMVYMTDTTMRGTEGFTIIRFPGTHTCISFNYLQNEYYWNLAFGVQDTSCQYIAPKICTGNSVNLNVVGGTSFKWSPSAGLNKDTGASVIATPSVTTTYYATDGICTDSILVTVNPYSAIAPGDTGICLGSAVQLLAGGGTSYKWSPVKGLSDPNIYNPVAFPSGTTTYTVTISPPPCDDSTMTVKITVYDTPPTPLIHQSYDTLICEVDPVFSSYQWYQDNRLIQGATDTFYVASESGNYNVAVTDTNGCLISVGINIILGIENSFGDHMASVFPNPANDQLTIHAACMKGVGEVTITILNVLGEVLKNRKRAYGRDLPVSIKDLPCGIYFIRLSGAEVTRLYRFVKN